MFVSGAGRLCSYLLIGFWYERPAARARVKAFGHQARRRRLHRCSCSCVGHRTFEFQSSSEGEQNALACRASPYLFSSIRRGG